MTKYAVEVTVQLELDDEGVADADDRFNAAWDQVETILQRAWDTDQSRHHVKKWNFVMCEGVVQQLEESTEAEHPR